MPFVHNDDDSYDSNSNNNIYYESQERIEHADHKPVRDELLKVQQVYANRIAFALVALAGQARSSSTLSVHGMQANSFNRDDPVPISLQP